MGKNIQEFNTCYDIVEKGVDLLRVKSDYLQITIVNKLRTLHCFISPAWLSVMLKYKKGGLTTLKKTAGGVEAIVLQELGMKYDPARCDYIEVKARDWRPQIVPETPEPAHQFSFYPDGRVSIEEKVNFIAAAKQEVVEVGVRLNTFSNYFITQNEQAYKMHIVDLLLQGVNIKGYLLDPDSQEARMYFDDRARIQPSEKDSIGDIKKTIERLKLVVDELDLTAGSGKFEIYQYKHIPYGFFLVVDAALDSGKMMIAPYLYGVRRANCPAMSFNKKDHPSLFRKYWDSLRHFTGDAKQLI